MPTNLFPLWVGAYNTADRALAEKVLRYVDKMGLDKFPGGVPNTLADTNEQWDYPNVWPPMQYVMIESMRNLNTNRSNELAFSWSQRWVRSNFIAYKRTQAMFEKVKHITAHIGASCSIQMVQKIHCNPIISKFVVLGWGTGRTWQRRRIWRTTRLRMVKWCGVGAPRHIWWPSDFIRLETIY